MSSLFVSGIPRSASVEDVETFLKRAFPSCLDTVVLRADDDTAHKGHAYVHFGSELEGRQAFARHGDTSSPLYFGEAKQPLRLRLARTPIAESALAKHDMAALPACHLDYCWARCAFAVDSVRQETDLLASLSASVISPAAAPMPIVVAFASHNARDEAVRAHSARFVRCGPPRLADLVGIPPPRANAHDVGPNTSEETSGRERKRAREENASAYSESSHRIWREHGLTALTPTEAIRVITDFFEQQNRVAFIDASGTVVLFRLPSYAAGFC